MMRLFKLLMSLLTAAFFVACGGGGGSAGLPSGTVNPITTSAPPSLAVVLGGTQAFTITGGKSPYRISSSNVNIAQGLISGSNFSISGLASGTATVVITDSAQQTASIAVTVGPVLDLYSDAPSTINMSPGTAITYTVGGGAPVYSVNSTDNRIATASMTGTKLTITARAVGVATVTVRDNEGKTIPYTVTVGGIIALYTTAPASLTIANGGSRSFVIGGGVPSYSAASSDNRVVTVALSGGSLTLQAVAPGSASILVKDTDNKQVTIAVTVGGSSPLGLYTSAPDTITLAKGNASTFAVGGGVAPYTATSSDSRVAIVALNGTTMIVNPVGFGTATVSIRDSGGASLSVALTVAGSSSEALFTTAPTTLSMSAGTTLSFTVGGGAQPYSVTSTDSRVVTGAISGTALTVSALKSGTAALQIVDALGKILQVVVTADGTSAGADGPAFIDILPSSSTLSSAPSSEVTFIVTVKDAVNSAIPNQVVTFTATSGTLTGASPAPSTDASGKITSISLSPGADAKNRVITVTATAGSISKSINIPVVGTTVTVSGAGSALVGAPALTYSVKALDSGGKPIGGAILTVSSSAGNTLSPATLTTDVSGSATFTYSPSTAGIDTLKVSGLGATAEAKVTVSDQDFSFALPDPKVQMNVGASNAVQVCYKVLGTVTPPTDGVTVTFSTTRGTLGTTNYPDAQGCTSTTISSTTAGPVTISAQMGTVRSSVNSEFVAITPATIILQANPGAVLPNAAGSTTNESTLSATVRDANGNPVANQVVNFTAIQDGSNGSIVPGSDTTDSNGQASVRFIPGALSTAANGVLVRAIVQKNSTLFSDAYLTVSGNALFLSIGVASTLQALDEVTYKKQFSVYVTDANGAPAANRAVSLSVFPTRYGKGTLSWYASAEPPTWNYSTGSPTICVNEDANRDGVLQIDEDLGDRNGKLDPGEDRNNNLVLDTNEDRDGDGIFDLSEDFNKNGTLDLNTNFSEDKNGNGKLDDGEDWNANGKLDLVLTTEDRNGNSKLDTYDEDLNGNSKFDVVEDVNLNGKLDPGLPVVISPSTVTTDATGNATFFMSYGKNFAWWATTQITARASVGGTESSQFANYFLEMLTADAQSPSSPANQISPFGTATVCTNPN